MSSGQREDEIAGGPSGSRVWRPDKWSTLTLGVAVAFVVGLIVGMQVNGSTDDVPAPTPSSGPSPTASKNTPTGPATNVLIPGRSSARTTATHGDVGVATFSTYLTNYGDRPLTPAGPVQLLAPDGTLVTAATVSLAAYEPHRAALTPFRPPPASIAPHGGKIMVVVSTLYDCDSDRYEAAWPDDYPRIVIPLREYEQPATYSFSDLFSGGASSFYSQLCPASDTAPTES